MQPNARALLASASTHPLALDVYLQGVIGAQYFTWDPAALWQELLREAQVPNIGTNVKSKILALCVVRGTLRAHREWPAFEKVVAAFNDVPPDFEVMQKPDLGQLLVAVGIIRGLQDLPFSEEVERYMAAALLTDDVVYAPPPLEFINYELLHHSPADLHEATIDAHKGGAVADEAVASQLAKLHAAKLYSDAASNRLLESLKVVDDALNTRAGAQ